MRQLRQLNRYLWKYRGRLFMGFVFICLVNWANVWAPELVKEGIDYLIQAFERRHSRDWMNMPLPGTLSWIPVLPKWIYGNSFESAITRVGLLLGAAYLLLYAVKGVFLFYQRQTIIVVSRYIEYDQKNEIYRHYQQLDQSFFRSHRVGDLMNRISEDVSRVRMYLGPGIMYTVNLAVMVVFCVVFMLRQDVELTLYALGPMPFMMAGVFYVSRIINRRTDRLQQQQSRLSVFVQEAFAGIRVLKAFNHERASAASFDLECEDYKQKQLSLVKADALFMPVMVLLVGLSTILTIYIGVHKVMAGTLSAGTLFQFVFYINLLTWPFAMVGWVSSLMQKAAASQARINEFLHRQPAIVSPAQPENLVRATGRIELRNVSFTYPETGISALHNVSFTIEPGQVVGIIGRTGSGKSTLAQLLCRFYDPTSGLILLDGLPLTQYNLNDLRNQFGYVPQDVFLFSDTIAHNLSFGVRNAGVEQLEQAARDAHVHHNIIDFPQGYQTVLGERGINLSGGQKQRLAIARALLTDPAILLLDDCLSAVDTETEEHILQALRRIMKYRTSIIIANRISSVRYADHIIVLDRGTIAEQGSHQQLLEADGIYAMIYRKQLLAATI